MTETPDDYLAAFSSQTHPLAKELNELRHDIAAMRAVVMKMEELLRAIAAALQLPQ